MISSVTVPELSPALFLHPVALLVFFFLVLLLLFLLRSRWLPLVSALPWYRARAQPQSALNEAASFLDDYRAGLSSSNFDLAANLDANDPRQGLDPDARAAILRAMDADPTLSFDEARRIHFVQKLRENNIGPDGLPNDPKALVFNRN